MKHSIAKLWLLFGLLLLPFPTWPATWFVRPGVYDGQDTNGNPVALGAVCGMQNGTNYDNAWNGLQAVVWGASGVNTGDTLYVCGTHIYSFTNDTRLNQQAATGTQSGVTIRMDWPDAPGLVFVGAIDSRPGTVWYGPDTNGVYWSPQAPLQAGTAWQTQTPLCFQVDGTAITPLTRKTNTTWVGDLGSAAFIGNTNFVKTTTGAAPSNNMAMAMYGWKFWFVSNTNITFRSCHFLGNFPFVTSGNKYIICDGCTFMQGIQLDLYYGHDYWTFANCEIGFTTCGIYTHINGQPRGPNYLIVTNCYIHDCDTKDYPDADGHGIGVQGGSFCLLTHNHIERTGSAIEFWTQSQPMSNNIISYNAISDTHVCKVSAGNGVSISGDNTLSVPGLRTGIRIFGNVIWNTQASGIGSNNKDYMEVFNNTIYNAQRGIGFGVIGGNAYGMVQNNIIVGTRGPYAIAIRGDTASTTNLLVNYNLYPGNATSANISVSSNVPHDQNSVFADTVFLSSTPSAAPGFQLRAGSKAIKAGIPAGLTQDFAGNPIPATAPDIGAYQYSPLSSGLLPPDGLRVEGQ